MQDRPSAAELLRDIAQLLEGEALEATGGALRHKIRVAGNLCRILEREAQAGATQDSREVELLADLLGEPANDRSAETLTRAVIARLDAGESTGFEQNAWRACAEIVKGKLAIAKPGHDAYDFATEQKE